MPYIKKENRKDIEKTIPNYGRVPAHAGELNYLITYEIHNFIERLGLSYSTINTCIGVLECAKLELYRIIAAPYENKTRLENGAVSDLDAVSLEDVR
jgi:hypothetical protein